MSTEGTRAPLCRRCARMHEGHASCRACVCCKVETASDGAERCPWCVRHCPPALARSAQELADARQRHVQRRRVLEHVTALYRAEDEAMRDRWRTACVEDEPMQHEAEKKIREARAAYELGAPTMSDREFDGLIDALKATAPASPVLDEIAPANARGEVAHAVPMLSLDKVRADEAVVAWAEKTGAARFFVSPKLDGVALSLTYENRALVRAVTRGDGTMGRDVTALARAFAPQSCSWLGGTGRVEVRGEVMLARDVYRATFATRGAATARNTVAGLLGRSTPDADHQALRFIAYDVLRDAPFSERLSWAGQCLPATVTGMMASSPAELIEALRFMRASVEAADFPYDTDGLVIRCDDKGIEAKLGATDHHPRYAVAYKWAGASMVAEVLGVTWDVSPAGTLTPVVVTVPTLVDGVVIERASLHHRAAFDTLALAPGDAVTLSRRGGVIPHVEGVATRGDEVPFSAPKVCPSCGAPAVVSGPFLRCENVRSCDGQRRARVVHFAATLGARGFGPAVVAQLGLLFPSDLFSPGQRARWPSLVGEATASKLLAELDAVKRAPLARWLEAFALPGLGGTTAARAAEVLAAPRDWTAPAAVLEAALAGAIGPVTAQKVARGAEAIMGQLEWWIDALARADIELDVPPAPAADGPFKGLAFVFTGELPDMSRLEAQAIVRKLGGSTPGSVTKATTHLVMARDAGARKRERADALRAQGQAIEVIDPDAFFALVQRAELLSDETPDTFD